jgi:hypothetical protein
MTTKTPAPIGCQVIAMTHDQRFLWWVTAVALWALSYGWPMLILGALGVTVVLMVDLWRK